MYTVRYVAVRDCCITDKKLIFQQQWRTVRLSELAILSMHSATVCHLPRNSHRSICSTLSTLSYSFRRIWKQCK